MLLSGVGVGPDGLQEEFENIVKAARHAMARKATGIVIGAILKCPAMNPWRLLDLPLDGLMFLPQERSNE